MAVNMRWVSNNVDTAPKFKQEPRLCKWGNRRPTALCQDTA